MTETSETHVARRGRRLTATVTDLEVTRQRAFLVGVIPNAEGEREGTKSLAELELLTATAGSDPVEVVLVRRSRPDPATYLGKGKVRELVADTTSLDIDVVVFDNELTPAQQRNLQKVFECDVVDRIALILDIFAQHATTKEGMLQVELAQHRYRLPRLRGKGVELSRLGGGIGTRGPGETKLETDRRRILGRIAKIERELKDAARSRATRSKARKRSGLPVVAIVGYTNAGKSTLFNQLTEANVLVEDQLFATLDSTVRKLELPEGHSVLCSDTVGFVATLAARTGRGLPLHARGGCRGRLAASRRRCRRRRSGSSDRGRAHRPRRDRRRRPGRAPRHQQDRHRRSSGGGAIAAGVPGFGGGIGADR